MWKNPLSEADIGLLTCRSADREYVCNSGYYRHNRTLDSANHVDGMPVRRR